MLSSSNRYLIVGVVSSTEEATVLSPFSINTSCLVFLRLAFGKPNIRKLELLSVVTLAPLIRAQIRKSFATLDACPDQSKKQPDMRYTNAIIGARASYMRDSEREEWIRGETRIIAISLKRVQWEFDEHINIQ